MLRIILVASTTLAIVIALLSFSDAVARGIWPVICVVVVSYVILAVALALSQRFPDLSALLLLGMFYLVGLTSICFNSIPEVTHFGATFLYVVPIVAWIFFGVRWACAAMVLNLVPFLYVIAAAPPLLLFGIDMALPNSHAYVHSLLFLLLNICIPLALFRVLKAINSVSANRDLAHERLKESNALYLDMFEHAGGPTLICDAEGVILEANRRAAEMLGHLFEYGTPRPRLDHLLEAAMIEDAPRTLIQLARSVGVSEGEFNLPRADGSRRDVYLRAVQLSADSNLLVTLRDLTNLRSTQRELLRTRERESHLELHDFLTNLPNRKRICTQIEEVLRVRRAQPDGAMVAVASIRLNSVRQVNEKFDVAAGDQLIRDFAELLLCVANEHVFLGRFRGVVFSMVFIACHSSSQLVDVIEAIKASLPDKLEIDGKTVVISTSIGVAFVRDETVTADELIRRSEHALEIARKTPERPFTFFDEDIAREAHRVIDIEVALTGAIDRQEFILHYQPKVCANGQIDSLEALLRWNSGELGPISPAEFIPIAERNGSIHSITNHVIEMVCRQLRVWLDNFGHAWPVAINLSGNDLCREDISGLIGWTCGRYEIPPQLIQFEITETGLIENGEMVIGHLKNLEQSGFTIALDDFGTGYSSLAKLSEFPISTIKIDRSFVAGIGHHERREQIVRATLSLARELDCASVAEGVETSEQAAFLISHGCNLFQGYLFHKPLPVAEISSLMEKHRRSLSVTSGQVIQEKEG